MRLVLLAGLLGILAVVPQACSRDRSSSGAASQSKDIITDLPDTGGEPASSMYYVNNGRIFRGRCVDISAFNRNDCSQELVSISYDTFKRDLDGGLSDTIRELTAESKQIQDAIAVIERDLADARAELDRLERQQGGLDSGLTSLRADIKHFEVNLSEYKQDLVLIDQALAQAADADTAAMRPIVMARIQEWQSRIAQVNVQIETIIAQFGQLHTQIATISARITELTTRTQNLHIELAAVDQRLELAYGDFSVYTETLRRLTSGIPYTVFGDNTILVAERLFIRRFEAIFAKHT